MKYRKETIIVVFLQSSAKLTASYKVLKLVTSLTFWQIERKNSKSSVLNLYWPIQSRPGSQLIKLHQLHFKVFWLIDWHEIQNAAHISKVTSIYSEKLIPQSAVMQSLRSFGQKKNLQCHQLQTCTSNVCLTIVTIPKGIRKAALWHSF